MLPTTPTDLHFRPPLDRAGELEWNTFDGILQQVRDPAKQVLAVDFCTQSEAGSLLDASAHLYRTATRRVGRNRKCLRICEATAGSRRAVTAWQHDPPHLLRS